MFTGIIQEIGQVKSLQRNNSEMRLLIDLKILSTKNLELGESIALNGSCHTLEKLNGSIGQFFSSAETLSKTNLGFLQINDLINLELSLTPNSRIGGHFVSGHIDGLAKLLSVSQNAKSYIVHFEIPSQFQKYTILKGSICLNGISLTIASLENNIISTAIIPHTWENTNLKTLKLGQLVNLEVDMLAKYTEKFLK